MGINNLSSTSKWTLGIAGVFGAFVIMIIGAIIMMYFSANNYSAATDALVQARYKDRQNVFSNYGQKVAEAAQVPAMYRDDLTKTMTSALAAKFGPEGSKAVFQWLQDAQIPYDASMYTKIQQIIESGRNDFQASQTAQLDVCRHYEGQIGSIPRGWFIRMAGFPKIDMVQMCKPITDDRTEAAFKSGKQETLQLRPTQVQGEKK